MGLLIFFSFLFLTRMDASQYMKYKVRSISSFISRSGCTESGLRTWALSQAVNTYYTSPNQLPAVQPNTFTYSIFGAFIPEREGM